MTGNLRMQMVMTFATFLAIEILEYIFVPVGTRTGAMVVTAILFVAAMGMGYMMMSRRK